jgi:hypothetical protein
MGEDTFSDNVFLDYLLYSLLTSVNFVSQESDLVSVYPNPTGSQINIKSHEAVSDVIIYTSSGEKVLTTDASKSIDISYMPNGFYIISVQTESGTYISKILKK